MTIVTLDTTTRTVEVFSGARDVQARADIAAHAAAADPHPQYLLETELANVATSGDAADVTFATMLEGAAPTTVAEALNNYIVVDWAGAKSDDTTDNTTKLQGLLDHLESLGGGVLYFAIAGTYRTGPLQIPNNVTLRGQGRQATILKVLSGTALTAQLLSPKSFVADNPARLAKNIVIEDLGFNGSARIYPKWLEHVAPHASAGTPVADPEADYYDATLNPSGKIGNPSYAADNDGVCLSQTPAGAGNLTINGAFASGGTATVAPIRRVTITAAANESARTFTIHGTDSLDQAKQVAIAGPDATTTSVPSTSAVALTNVFKTVTQVEVDGATAGAVQVGTAEFDIFALAEEGRRNKNYNTTGSIIDMAKVDGGAIRRCHFFDHENMAIRDLGCLDLVIEDCLFERCGKDDGAFHGIWCQSYGNPSSPPTGYQDSEATRIHRNVFRDMHRIPILFAPTKGGVCDQNRMNNVNEGGIFIHDHAALNGGRIVIRNNHIKDVVISDIVANGIELGKVRNILIDGNYIEGAENAAIHAPAVVDLLVTNNHFKNNGKVSGTFPYGPFSERFDFGIGTAPLAGISLTTATFSEVTVGSVGSVGNQRVRFAYNTFEETRGAFPTAYFKQTKAGTSNIAKDVYIENNNVNIPAAMAFFDATTITGVWDAEMSLWIRNNNGHPSERPKIEVKVWAASDLAAETFELGFRPSRIDCSAITNNPTQMRAGIGTWVWDGASTGERGAMAFANDGTTPQSVSSTTLLQLISETGTVIGQLAVAMHETGVTVTPSTNSGSINARFVFTP
jgi:hypothetical protein